MWYEAKGERVKAEDVVRMMKYRGRWKMVELWLLLFDDEGGMESQKPRWARVDYTYTQRRGRVG